MIKIAKYTLIDILHSKIILLYAALLFIATYSIFYFSGDSSKSIISILNVVLILIPLVSIIYSTNYYFNAYEYIQLLAAQPISRTNIIFGLYAGVSTALVVAFAVGAGLPLLVFDFSEVSFFLLLSSCLLTLCFTSIAFLASILAKEKSRGVGISLLLWLYFTIIYDALILAIIYLFNDYPLEKVTIVLTSLNPVDLSRILILLKLDISALMGFTGAVYQQYFQSGLGIIITLFVLLLWVIVPLYFVRKFFKKKNL